MSWRMNLTIGEALDFARGRSGGHANLLKYIKIVQFSAFGGNSYAILENWKKCHFFNKKNID